MSLSRESAAAVKRYAIVTVAGLDLSFESMSGGGVTVGTTLEDLTGDGTLQIIPGRTTWEPIVLTAALAPYRDLEWLRTIRRQIGVGRFTITRQWTDAN